MHHQLILLLEILKSVKIRNRVMAFAIGAQAKERFSRHNKLYAVTESTYDVAKVRLNNYTIVNT